VENIARIHDRQLLFPPHCIIRTNTVLDLYGCVWSDSSHIIDVPTTV
jgi:hypothetical protein